MSEKPRKRGRPGYSDEVREIILQRLAEGQTLRQACRGDDMPGASGVLDWVVNDKPEGFSEQYAHAREIGYRVMADEVLEIADDGTNDWVERENKDGSTYAVLDTDHVQRSRLRVDTRKWLLAKALPKVYGDKLQHTGEGGGPVVFEMHMADGLDQD